MLSLFALSRLFLSSKDKNFYDKIRIITSLSIRNPVLYKIAFQHKCNKTEHFSNERLEFLGDAALSLIVGDYLFKQYPLQDEGFLTDIRSRIVNRESLGLIARKIGLDLLLEYDSSHGRSRHIYGNALEALVGAVYLDRGYNNCYNFVMNQIVKKYLDLEHLIANDTNYKSAILEWASKNHRHVVFESLEKIELEGHKSFQIQILLDTSPISIGEGKSKKQAEQNAARKAIEALNIKSETVL